MPLMSTTSRLCIFKLSQTTSHNPLRGSMKAENEYIGMSCYIYTFFIHRYSSMWCCFDAAFTHFVGSFMAIQSIFAAWRLPEHYSFSIRGNQVPFVSILSLYNMLQKKFAIDATDHSVARRAWSSSMFATGSLFKEGEMQHDPTNLSYLLLLYLMLFPTSIIWMQFPFFLHIFCQCIGIILLL